MSTKLKREGKKILLALAIFAVLFAAERLGAFSSLPHQRLILTACYLVPYLICGLPVLKNAVHGIRNGQMLDESFLMAVASVGALVIGESEEAAAVMLFYQVGEWFQSYAVGKSRKSISDLMDIAPETAWVEQEDGSVEEVDPDEVEIGDVLVIRAGEKIPVDAVVLTGESMINTAALTGESVPRTARAGDPVISGCINGEGLLRVRAEKRYEDSTVAKILELVETASDKKSKTENFITRFARVYTPTVVIAALLLAVVPSIVTRDPLSWIYRACTFLVVSCPCALVISVPLAFFGGIGAASRNGVLVKGSNYLELLAHIDTVVSDKTGTLTEGNFKVSSVLPAEGVSPEELLRVAKEAEGLSTHPIALSIREAWSYDHEAEKCASGLSNVETIPGEGLIATVQGRKVLVGNLRLMERHGIRCEEAGSGAETVCHVASDSNYLGAILIRDAVKETAKSAIAEMKKAGVQKVVMLTGDRKGVAEAVGRELKVDQVYSELLPQDKVQKVEELLAKSDRTHRVAFVGDGINDAPVLTRSDIGIAMGSLGSDAAIEAADVVIMDDNLMRIPAVIKVARKTVAVSKQNIGFALGVKAVILVLTTLGISNMWAAVFADVGVAVICILNSMRLLLGKWTIR